MKTHMGDLMINKIEFWEKTLKSVEILDARGLITKIEKHKIHKRMKKQLDEDGIVAEHVGFREWKCADEMS